jgi:acyl-CoA thioesterase YciA
MPAPEGWDLITRHLVLQKDLGGADRLFGGIMLAWLDEAGASYAIAKAGTGSLVTRHITEMDFVAPAYVGDVLSFYGRVARLGTTSISIEMQVFAEDPNSTATRKIVATTFVFVAIDKWGNKVPLRSRP